ncbi:MAG: ATP synthase F1 subunit epsilon [Candidatus Vogelbacteria bacterium RIFOXYD1_FULL_46_19]|uniref:ATP synthase epsilon chain n=1 Tax=Candidatus Vogelbacteria bacterium RIFOXYD1_FULL_46_19 TaxID=1802439 RepID=A0A1G2QG57_9BACT|nr:MAG: ATP synthase F1 subunit epsilon [Candidatus Vogelbacteria bacterium RIFOXYD1_FULL_46_19]
MSAVLHFTVVTPDRVIYEADIEQATIPTREGEITVLANHMPLVSLLAAGEMTVKKNQKETVHFVIAGGVLEVRPGSQLVILTDFAEHATDIDLAEAEAARARAAAILAQGDNLAQEDFARLETVLERELARLKVGRRHLK